MTVCGDAWSRTTLLKNQLLSFAKLLFALYPCRARHPRLSRRPSQAASTLSKIHIFKLYEFKQITAFTGSCYYITKKITKSIEGMHGVEPCLGQTLCAHPCRARHPRLSRRSSQTASTSFSNFVLHFNNEKPLSGDAWSRTTLALISYAFLRSIRAALGIPVCQGDLHRQPQHSSNTKYGKKLKMKKIFPFPRLGSSCSFKTKQKINICNHNPISVIPQQAVCRRSAGVWRTTQTGAHQCATAPGLQPLSR